MRIALDATWRSAPLPTMLAPVLGRDHDADRVDALLRDPAHRLVTITGPGGVGKTCLALHVARRIARDDARDVLFVPLASIRDPALVVPAICQAFGIAGDAGDAGEAHLEDLVRGRCVLVVLDNLEQVREAAPAIAALLARCPEIDLLVTSQALLGIPGEQLYPLRPLAPPTRDHTTMEAILASDAVRLFLERARAVQPDLALDARLAGTIADICRRLDGLPLAIELAAARMNILSPEALLARLSNRLQVLGGERADVPDRLRTMRHAIDWSYDLLTPHEQALFRRLAVFEGGIALDAVEAMFRPTGDNRDALGVLGALVNHSMLHASSRPSAEPRFLMLETLRDYGCEVLLRQGEDAGARTDHAAWVLALAEAAAPTLVGSAQETWLARLDDDLENIRSAIAWTIAHGRADIGLRIAAATWRYCAARGLVTEGRGWLGRALDLTANAETVHRVRALNGAGFLAEDQRDLANANTHFTAARDLAARLGCGSEECQAWIGLGTVAHDRGEYGTAHTCHARAADLAHALGDRRAIAIAAGNLAAVAYYQGNLDDAERWWEETRLVAADLGDVRAEAVAAGNLAALAMDRDDLERARALLTRVLDVQRSLREARDIPYTLANLADTWRRLGDLALAETLFTEAETLLRQAGDSGALAIVLASYARLPLARGDFPRVGAMLLESTATLAESGDQLDLGRNAETLAEACHQAGLHPAAAELLAAAGALRARIGAPPVPADAGPLDTLREALRQALGETALRAAVTRGAALDGEALPRRIAIVAHELIAAPPATPARAAVDHHLTGREREVLRLLAEGRSTRDISDALCISPRTTATHIANILGKLEMPTRTAAVAYAMRTGLVSG